MSFEKPWYMKPFEEAIKNMDNSVRVLPQDGEEMTETHNISGEPVDYQDRMAQKMQRMVGYDYQSAHDNGYLEGLATGIAQGKRETIMAMLEIIDEIERDKKIGYVIMDGSILCNTRYIKDKVMALKGGEHG